MHSVTATLNIFFNVGTLICFLKLRIIGLGTSFLPRNNQEMAYWLLLFTKAHCAVVASGWEIYTAKQTDDYNEIDMYILQLGYSKQKAPSIRKHYNYRR